ncbi:PREDICTED: cytochrome P450 6j1-like [Nicrophorus vespilloides]|uniref:Cytochrome P450 6j1-like n=1 Tax=Nicrophorus vespilloides TaxID=110193 RepID=A0ABM1NI86_NICVS|nr:PREDICTED: cytochrome P450 6j1-like [Nicrophorus vespilloides]
MILTILATLLCVLYVYLKKRYNHWKDRGVPYEEPTLLVGNLGSSLISKRHIGEIYNAIYKKCRITKGMNVMIPIDSIYMDEQYFDNPHQFRPERFYRSNKSNVRKSTFFPFGDGPRICIGMRFALLQIKTALVAIFSKYTITLNEKTIIPLRFEKNGVLRVPFHCNMWMIILVATFLCVLYVYLKKRYNHWKDRGVPYEEPTLFVGNLGPSLTSKQHIGEIYNEIYKKYEGFRYVGVYTFLHPALVIRDPDLINDVVIKDFHHFEKNNFEADVSNDPIMGRNPFALSGEKWKTVRAQWTPNFTSGKIKQMFPFVKDQSEKLLNYMEDHASCIDVKDLLKRYNIGVVASCAFGLEANSFSEEESEFVKIASEIGDVSGFSMIKMTLISIFPQLAKFTSVRFFTKHAENYLIKIVEQTLEYRRKNNVVRNDFLHNLAEQKDKSSEYKMEDIDIVAQAAGFFGDGVESSSVVASFILHDLAQNPAAQQKLQQEIMDLKGEITYDTINSMEYLECVIYESMRMHPAVLFLTRKCTKDYVFPPPKEGGSEVRITKGMDVMLPVDSIQMDERYFDNPHQFKPERFSKSNKSNVRKCTFFPFGEGPRACIGMRFGLLQIKMVLVAIFSKFTITLNEKTMVPLQLEKNGVIRVPVGGIWADFHKI